MEKIEIGFNLAVKNEQVIHGALKRAGIYITRFDYEDYVQEGFITYAKCFEKYPHEFVLEKFNVYAFQKIVWHCLDLLRKEQMYTQRFILDSFEQNDYSENESIDVMELLQNRCKNLTEFEYQILISHFIEKVPLVDIAKQYSVSDRYLRKVRNSLRKKLGVS